MARPKTFLMRLEVDAARKSHNCQHSDAHRVAMGASRLKVTDGRSSEHYCVACAIKFLEADAARIAVVLAELRAASPPSP
jgi:hypothetical protein